LAKKNALAKLRSWMFPQVPVFSSIRPHFHTVRTQLKHHLLPTVLTKNIHYTLFTTLLNAVAYCVDEKYPLYFIQRIQKKKMYTKKK